MPEGSSLFKVLEMGWRGVGESQELSTSEACTESYSSKQLRN